MWDESYELHRKNWDNALLAACDVQGDATAFSKRLPQIASPISFAGTIARYFIEKYGFSSACSVAIGSGDNPQTKVLSEEALLSLGSSFVMMSPRIEKNAIRDDMFHPYANAMYDGVERPFLFACRTNGSLVWDRVRNAYNADIAMGDAALQSVEIGQHSTGMLWQPLEESFSAIARSKMAHKRRFCKRLRWSC